MTFGGGGRFHFDLLEGLYAAAADHGYDLILSAVTPDRGEQQALESLADFRFDGLVMLGPPVAEPGMAGSLPVAVMGWSVEDDSVDVVRTSDVHGMSLAVDHLVQLGHRRIAHLDGGSGLVAVARREAYIKAMAERGLGDDVLIVSGGEDSLAGLRAAGKLIAAAELPTAVVAFNDDTAAAAVSLFAQEGIDVPGRISVIGWDDSHLAQNPDFDLTSVAQRPHEMARVAIERIVARCDGSEIGEREVVLEPTLVVRSSTAPPSADVL
ncbi:substrate-binding domain-containing protein [Sinomonas sp. JGH33]|uniref:Substrate-binding domain-containing protein n=1 Tax=Sinomonas terricola TaxID=3110330 RepID=A0ABU5TAC3_9MICC|nr:substrate-binding domain-containing protein [Sinomonas sp. JGH33]MEA5456533.1 substrate-binding domain-containing protein [Sinomonas sp. JGH33]